MLKLLNTRHWFFTFFIILQMMIYNYPYILKIEPRTVHAWRQFDCLSFAQNFYNNNATLFEPAINNLGYTGTGKTASEFPIVPYLVGNIWKVTGINSSIYKFVNVLFLFFGLFYIYKLFLYGLKDKIISVLITAIIFTSPILSYYGVSTLSDIQSFSLCMSGFYFFYKWLHERQKNYFILYLLLFTLAGLIKASSGLIYILTLLFFVLHSLQNKDRKIFLHLLLAVIPIVICMSWYIHAEHYNVANNQGFFLIGTLPIWNMNAAQISAVTFKFFNGVIKQVFSTPQLILLLAAFIYTLIKGGKENVFKRSILLICILLFVAFVILFFEAMDVHDYYLINPFGILVIAIFMMSSIWYEKLKENNYKKLIIALLIIIVPFSYITSLKTWNKINCNVDNFERHLVFNGYEQKGYFWIYWHDRAMHRFLEEKSFNISELGISPKDAIFCLGDQTINRTLYMLNRRGYSSFNAPPEKTEEFLAMHPEIKHVVLIDPTLKTKYYLKKVLANKIFEKESFSVYKVN